MTQKLKDIKDELEVIRGIIITKMENYAINYDPNSWNCSCDGIDYAIMLIDNAIEGDDKK